MAYDIGNLPLDTLFGPVGKATEALVRLDERLARSPVRDGWIERSHFHDAVAAVWLEGELVHVEDLVFRDAEMDQRAPTHELARAHFVLRRRRRILSQRRDWALSKEGLRELTGRREPPVTASKSAAAEEGERYPDAVDVDETWQERETDELAEEFAEIDALLARSSTILNGGDVPARRAPQGDERMAVLYDPDWDEDARLAEWRAFVDRTRGLPPVLRAALIMDAWHDIEVLQRGVWIGALLAGAVLREEGITANHLACLHLGSRNIPRERRRACSRTERVGAIVDAIRDAATVGLKEHDRLFLAKEQLERALVGRRTSSKLPALVDLVLSRPMISTNMIQEALGVSRQGALNLIGEFSLRELTGRGSFRAWGIV